LFSSVFGDEGLNILQASECPAYKVASFEANDTELISKVAQTGKPLIISTGMCSPQEIIRLKSFVNPRNTCFMHCVSKYPHDLSEAQLFKINWLKGFYPIVVGYSDHCNSFNAMEYAIALGAKVIEKHFTLKDETEDGDFSITPIYFNMYK